MILCSSRVFARNSIYKADDEGCWGYKEVRIIPPTDMSVLCDYIDHTHYMPIYENIRSLRSRCFISNSSLFTASFPNCEIIGEYAFASCSYLYSISFPVCKEIGSYAFFSCSQLRNVSFDQCEIVYAGAFTGCIRISDISFPCCKRMDDNAFRDCRSLRQISFPMCEEMNGLPFYGCTALESLYLPNNSVVSIQYASAFWNTPFFVSSYLGHFGSIYIPEQLYSDYIAHSVWSIYSERLVPYRFASDDEEEGG